jgi:hypothetical protein
MNNPLPLRILMAFVMMITVTAGFLAFAYLKFPENAVVIFLAVAVTLGVVFFIQRKEKAARFNVYYTTVRELGQPVNFGNLEAAFERAGTRFDVQFPKDKHNQVFKVTFHIPNLGQKFSIQNRTLATRFAEDCRVIEDSPLPPDFLVQSRNPAFLLNFLKNRTIFDEILSYKSSFWGRILIALDDGDFEMAWAPPISEQVDGFYRICQSAAVFHDELKRISELPQ